MAEPQAPQAFFPKGVVSELRDIKLTFIADQHIFNKTDPIDENTYLATRFLGQLRHSHGKLRGYQISRRDSAAIEPFQGTQMTRLQTSKIAKRLSYCEVLSQRRARISAKAPT
jgi:PBP1b-binding outer membrane lipoprotein LpoB